MKPKSKFLLNPDHKDFIPRKSRLQFEVFDTYKEWKYSCWGIFLPIIILAAILWSILIVGGTWWLVRFATNSADTIAIVTDIDCREYEAGKDYVEKIFYTYTVNDIVYENVHSVENEQSTACNIFPDGTNLEAKYLLDDPSQSQITQADLNPSFLYNAIGYIFGIGMGALLWWVTISLIGYMVARRNYRLLRKQSVLLEGEIIKAEREIRGEHIRFHHVKITYEFETPDGRLLTRSLVRQRDDLWDKELPAIGTPVTVLYADDFAVIVL